MNATVEDNKTVDEYLDEVRFEDLNDPNIYKPSTFALKFLSTIKLINGEKGTDNKSPIMHLAMIDKIASKKRRLANLCARGTAKTTLFMEYLCLYIALWGGIPGFGKISGIIYVSDSMENGVKSARNSIRERYYNSEFLQYWIPVARFVENEIEFENRDGHKLMITLHGATSGIRGGKIYGKRPVLALLDDLVSDSSAKSPTAMAKISDLINAGVTYALDPNRFKIILNGTPFNKNDVVYKAIESGAWDVNVWPICERFPCTKEEFRGCWEDRFSFEYVNDMYIAAKKGGNLKSFNQELMLRISTDETKLVQDDEVKFSRRDIILANKNLYNFYATTDLAVSSKQTADFSVISIWAVDWEGNWTYVDGICKRQSIDITIKELFGYATEYPLQCVGIEVSGQQLGFVSIIQEKMVEKNIYFNIEKIKPASDKLSRFNLAVPLFKAGKIHYATELADTKAVKEHVTEISYATEDGLKGKDDCLDTISMIPLMPSWIPSKPEDDTIVIPTRKQHNSMESNMIDYTAKYNLNNTTESYGSYIV